MVETISEEVAEEETIPVDASRGKPRRSSGKSKPEEQPEETTKKGGAR